MKPNARKYIDLDKRMDKCSQRIDWYSYGSSYNSEKLENWQERLTKLSKLQSQLEEFLTNEEKQQIMDHYLVNDMWDLDNEE